MNENLKCPADADKCLAQRFRKLATSLGQGCKNLGRFSHRGE